MTNRHWVHSSGSIFDTKFGPEHHVTSLAEKRTNKIGTNRDESWILSHRNIAKKLQINIFRRNGGL